MVPAVLLVPAVWRMLARTALPSMLLSITSDLLTGESPVYLDTDTLTFQPQKQSDQGELIFGNTSNYSLIYIDIYLY